VGVCLAAVIVAPGVARPASGVTTSTPGSVAVLPATIRATDYNEAPSSRTVVPVAVKSTFGTVFNAAALIGTGGGTAVLSGAGSYVTLDFGKEVGGGVSASLIRSDPAEQVQLAYSESPLYAGPNSDSSKGGATDGAIDFDMLNDSQGQTTKAHERGGFRYLTVILRTAGWVNVSHLSVALTFAPNQTALNAYPNYFRSSDDLLNRIWYAGAYTVQTNTLDTQSGRRWPAPWLGWDNSAAIGRGTSVLADGAKRDRTVWPGDLSISLPTDYVSTNDLASAKNSLMTMYAAQGPNGELPYAGPPINFYYVSDTYDLATLLGTSTYLKYSDDTDFFNKYWPGYLHGLQYAIRHVDPTNDLFGVWTGEDWGRSMSGGGVKGDSLEANALFYGVLKGASFVARTYAHDAALAASYDSTAANVRTAASAFLFDPKRGLFREEPGSNEYPQDGNALALWFGLAYLDTPAAVTAQLRGMFNAYGAVTPEKAGAIATFPGSMEVHGLFAAHADLTALDLIRREWGYMLKAPIGNQSTFWEGYRTDGSFDYGGSYMSLSHGWATGPTAALTFYLLGLRPDVHSQFEFLPQPGDVTSAEGRLTLPGGAADASWKRDPYTGRFTAHVVASPGTSISRIGIPKGGSHSLAISVNGTDVWVSGGRILGSHYDVSEDSDFVYLTGLKGQALPAGTYDVVAQPDAVFDSSYRTCAVEGATCAVADSRIVAYGAGDKWDYRWVTGSVACTVGAFGRDPAPGVAKKCYAAPGGAVRYNLPDIGPLGYTHCAYELETCSYMNAPRMVAYGANGSFTYKVKTGPVRCVPSEFGNPKPVADDRCYNSAGRPGPDWTACGGEGDLCPAQPGDRIRYGGWGVYNTSTVAGNTRCTADDLGGGDPMPGYGKACWIYTPRPPS
jgi:hypothetical protein